MLSFRFDIDKTRKLVYYTTMTVIQERKEELMEYNSSLPIYLQVANFDQT